MSFATVVRTFVFACFKHLVCGVPAPAVESTCGSAYEGRQCEKASPLSEIEGLLQDDVVGGVGLLQWRSTQLEGLGVVQVQSRKFENASGDAWEHFKHVYDRKYESDGEESLRYSYFQEKIEVAKQWREDNPSAVHGVNKFSDWSSVEFKSALLTFKASTEEEKKARPTHHPNAPRRFPQFRMYFGGASGSINVSLPDSWDWREHGALTPIKNQGYCGSCWAFASVGNVESIWYLSGNDLPILSEQQVVSCDTTDLGCSGGLMQTAFEYVMSAPVEGLVSGLLYAYSSARGATGVCNSTLASPEHRIASITGYAQVSMSASEESGMRRAVLSSPFTIAINGGSMETYISGVDCPKKCTDDVDHAVMLVGYGTQKKKYWLIRNTWGSDWGEEGYYRLCSGKNKCGVASDAVAALNTK